MSLPPLILIVDDDPDFLEIFSTRLGAAGMRTETASDGNAALLKAKELKPDLILMDMIMPGMTGAEVLMKLREESSDQKVKLVFLSNMGGAQPEAQEINKKYSQDAGAVGYLKKTDDLDLLVNQILGLLK